MDNESNASVDEGLLTFERTKVISNKSLCRAALGKGLESLLKSAKLEPYLNFMPLGCRQPQGLEEKVMSMERDFQDEQSSQNGQADLDTRSVD